jgi:hypothetical protein
MRVPPLRSGEDVLKFFNRQRRARSSAWTEPGSSNPWVGGSNPSGRAIDFSHFVAIFSRFLPIASLSPYAQGIFLLHFPPLECCDASHTKERPPARCRLADGSAAGKAGRGG